MGEFRAMIGDATGGFAPRRQTQSVTWVVLPRLLVAAG